MPWLIEMALAHDGIGFRATVMFEETRAILSACYRQLRRQRAVQVGRARAREVDFWL